MSPFERLFRWAGGAAFAGALAFCAYTFVFVWSRDADVNGAAVMTDALLFTIFAAHHSVFAREPVKSRVARLVPVRLLRSSYVWIASLLLMGVCGLWQPIGGTLYDAAGWRAAAHASVQIAGLLLIAGAVRKIDAL